MCMTTSIPSVLQSQPRGLIFVEIIGEFAQVMLGIAEDFVIAVDNRD